MPSPPAGANHTKHAKRLFNAAAAHHRKGNLDTAAQLYQQAYAAAHTHKVHPELVANCLNNLGTVHRDLGRYKQATEAYTQAMEVFTRFGTEDKAANCRLGLGNVHLSLGRFEQAFEAYAQAVEIYTRLGLVHHTAGRYKRAESCLNKARRAFGRWVGVADPSRDM